MLINKKIPRTAVGLQVINFLTQRYNNLKTLEGRRRYFVLKSLENSSLIDIGDILCELDRVNLSLINDGACASRVCMPSLGWGNKSDEHIFSGFYLISSQDLDDQPLTRRRQKNG